MIFIVPVNAFVFVSLCVPDTLTLCAEHTYFVCRTQSLCVPDTVTLCTGHTHFVCRTQSPCVPDTITLCAGHSHLVCRTQSLCVPNTLSVPRKLLIPISSFNCRRQRPAVSTNGKQSPAGLCLQKQRLCSEATVWLLNFVLVNFGIERLVL